ncbi:hypothetical protein TWF191_003346 [Orbilia oligospora]|uniref:Uncharacterized protein n=1 Tax=Orbilia oligospora TaxID=2813651 RepID=A0A7C8R0H8_ORBOL|nr:hypothetical protein TWF191_003346 [Orbilia oligospora]
MPDAVLDKGSHVGDDVGTRIRGIPVEDTIEADVVRDLEGPSKTEPIQATPKHLVPRPVWTSYYSRSFSIRCDEPGVAFDQAQARSAAHADRLVP